MCLCVLGWGVCVGGVICQKSQFFFFLSFCFYLKIKFGAKQEGSTQLGFLYPLTQVMVLHTEDYMEAKC